MVVFFASSNARRRPRSSSTRRAHRRNPVVSFRTGCSLLAKGQKVECCSLPFTQSRIWDPKRGSQSASSSCHHRALRDERGKNAIFDERCEREIDFDERRHFLLTVLLTENSYSPTGSCDRTLIDSRLSSSSSPMSNASGDASSVVGAAPTPSRKEDL